MVKINSYYLGDVYTLENGQSINVQTFPHRKEIGIDNPDLQETHTIWIPIDDIDWLIEKLKECKELING